MKLKGINPIEQHVEKIVLAVVGIVFVGVLAVQFLISPNEVDYDGTKVPPNQVLTRLGSKAEALLSSMNDPDPTLPAIETPDLSASYAEKLASASFDAPRLASAPLGDSFGLSFTAVESVNGPVTPLRLPDPSGVLAVSQWTTVDPFFAASHPGLDPYLPQSQPMDKVSVTIEAMVNGELIEEALRTADEGRRAIPSHWWSDGGQGLIEVLTVAAERQRQQADGSWGEPERVESVRWSPDVLQAYNEGVPETETVDWAGLKARDLRELSGIAQSDPSLVAQPLFIPSIAGVEWVRPSKVAERQARLEVEARIGRVEREIENLENEIAQIEEQRTARSTQQANRPTQPTQPTGGGGLIRGGGQPTRANRPNRPDPLQQRIDAKREEIAERQTSLDALFEELDEFAQAGIGQSAQPRRTAQRQPAAGGGRTPAGGGPRILGGGPRVLGGDPSPRTTVRRRTVVGRTPGVESPGPLLSVEDYSVWVHDFTAEPGATYRYRVRYGVNNPLFGRERSIGSDDEELVALAGEPVVESDWSAWTDPVQVGRTSYFFVTNARDQGQLGQSASAATAEVFRMFYGYYRKHTITLEPGDAVQGEFRLPDDLPLFAVGEVEAGELDQYFAERDGGQATVARPAVASGDDADADDARDWLTMVEPRYPLSVDAVMLDVAEFPIVDEAAMAGGAARRILEVVFFDPISGVVARRPDRDREMPEYLAVQQSAGLAESAKVRQPDLDAIP